MNKGKQFEKLIESQIKATKGAICIRLYDTVGRHERNKQYM